MYAVILPLVCEGVFQAILTDRGEPDDKILGSNGAEGALANKRR